MTTDTRIVKTDRIDRHDGVDAFGLHLEFIRFNRTSKRLHSQVQVFLVNNQVYLYQRANGTKKARWTTLFYADHVTAKEQLRTFMAKVETDLVGAMMRGEPTLVQLTEADMEAIKNGLKPSARYDGGTRNNRLFGKIDDETWVAP